MRNHFFHHARNMNPSPSQLDPRFWIQYLIMIVSRLACWRACVWLVAVLLKKQWKRWGIIWSCSRFALGMAVSWKHRVPLCPFSCRTLANEQEGEAEASCHLISVLFACSFDMFWILLMIYDVMICNGIHTVFQFERSYSSCHVSDVSNVCVLYLRLYNSNK